MRRCIRFDGDRRLITVDGEIAYLTIVRCCQVKIMIAAPVDIMINGDVTGIPFLFDRVADDQSRIVKSFVKRFDLCRQENVEQQQKERQRFASTLPYT